MPGFDWIFNMMNVNIYFLNCLAQNFIEDRLAAVA
jgi:hypothetical protein